MIVRVCEPSTLFVALCAFSTEADLHKLRLLGRSCARTADLFWLRDGRVRGRALSRSLHRVQSLADVDNAERAADKPHSMLALFGVLDDAMRIASVSLPMLIELAARTMQDDSLVLLYVLVYLVTTDRAAFVDKLLQGAERGTAPAPKQQQKAKRKAVPAASVDNDDEDLAAACAILSLAARAEDEAAAATTHDDDNNDDDVDDKAHEEVKQPIEVVNPFVAWWPKRGERSPLLSAYFKYVYPTRCMIRFAGGADDVAQMTLADHIFFFAGSNNATNTCQLLWNMPEMRSAMRGSVFHAVCGYLTHMLTTAAEAALRVSRVATLLNAEGRAEVERAAKNDCASIDEHFCNLARNAALVDTLVRYSKAKSDDELDEHQLSLLRPYLGTARTDTTPEKPQGSSEPPDWTTQPDLHVVLAYAACEDNLVLVRHLLEGADKLDPAHDDSAVLRIAARCGSINVVRHLLAHKRADPAALEQWAFYWAVRSNHTATALLLLDDERVDPTAHDQFAICHASITNQRALVQVLLRNEKVDPNARDGTPLVAAMSTGNQSLLEMLLSCTRIKKTHHGKALTAGLAALDKATDDQEVCVEIGHCIKTLTRHNEHQQK